MLIANVFRSQNNVRLPQSIVSGKSDSLSGKRKRRRNMTRRRAGEIKLKFSPSNGPMNGHVFSWYVLRDILAVKKRSWKLILFSENEISFQNNWLGSTLGGHRHKLRFSLAPSSFVNFFSHIETETGGRPRRHPWSERNRHAHGIRVSTEWK